MIGMEVTPQAMRRTRWDPEVARVVSCAGDLGLVTLTDAAHRIDSPTVPISAAMSKAFGSQGPLKVS